MPAGPEAKESPGFFDLMTFFRSPNIFCTVVQCWESNAKAKLRQGRSVTSSKTNVKEHVPVQKITQNYDANSILPWRRAPDQRQRSAGRYISWQKAKSTRNCGARLRLVPINHPAAPTPVPLHPFHTPSNIESNLPEHTYQVSNINGIKVVN